MPSNLAQRSTIRTPGLAKVRPVPGTATSNLQANHVGHGDERRSWLELQRTFALQEGADLDELLAGRRTRAEKRARYRCWAILHFRYGNSQSAIARAYGYDPSAVCDALKKPAAAITDADR